MKPLRPFTRVIVEARRAAGLTQADAAPLLGVADRTLQKYEQEELALHPDTAKDMARAYRDPRLRTLYCEQECSIGKEERPCGCEKSAEAIMLDLILTDTDKLPETVKTLRKIMSDGVIDENEQQACEECLAFLDELGAGIKGLRLAVEAMRSSNRRSSDDG